MEPSADAAPERARIATLQLNLNTGRWRPLTEGYGFLAPLAAATLVAARTMPMLAPVPAVLGGLIALAFRDPERDIQQRAGAVLSPADGRVLRVSVEFDTVPGVC